MSGLHLVVPSQSMFLLVAAGFVLGLPVMYTMVVGWSKPGTKNRVKWFILAAIVYLVVSFGSLFLSCNFFEQVLKMPFSY